MEINKSGFGKLPFSKLFQDYCSGSGTIYSYFETNPAKWDSVLSFQETFNFKGDRNRSANLLKKVNQAFLNSDVTKRQIENIRDPNSLVIATGQQVTLFGGPLFTVYKTITAILYARRLEKKIGSPVVPVFWLADEDHDIDEVATIHLPDSNSVKSVFYDHKGYIDAPPASTITLGNELEKVRDLLKNALDETDFTGELLHQIDDCYRPDRTFGKAFGELLMKYFGKHGLLLAGSLDPEIKSHTKHLIAKAVESHAELSNSLDDTTYSLKEDGYHDQVQIQPSNLFYLNEEGQRIKIQFVDDKWSIPGKKWSTDELLTEIDETPENFSPNVFLRPVLQDHLLPVAGYVGGPGEIAYYAQMKAFYEVFGHRMPVIIPRFSITIFESAINRILDELPFEWPHYLNRIEDLEKQFVETHESADIEKIFGIWKSHIDELSHAKRKEIGKIDPTLKASVGKAKATYFSELDKLKGKVYRSVKDQEKIQIDRIKRIKNNLFPNGNLQEREIAFIYYLNKYGPDFYDRILNDLEEEVPYNHLSIHL